MISLISRYRSPACFTKDRRSAFIRGIDADEVRTDVLGEHHVVLAVSHDEQLARQDAALTAEPVRQGRVRLRPRVLTCAEVVEVLEDPRLLQSRDGRGVRVHGGDPELVVLAPQVAQRLRHVRQRDIRDVLAERELLDQLQQVVRVEGLLPPTLLGVAPAGAEQSLRDLLVGGELQQAVRCESDRQMPQTLRSAVAAAVQGPGSRPSDRQEEWRRCSAASSGTRPASRPCRRGCLDDDDALQRLATSIIFLTFSRLASSRKAEKSIMKPPPCRRPRRVWRQ